MKNMKKELLNVKEQMEEAASSDKAIHERFVKFDKELDRLRLQYNIPDRKEKNINKKETTGDKHERKDGNEKDIEYKNEENKEVTEDILKKEAATECEIKLEKKDGNHQDEEKVGKGENMVHDINGINEMEEVEEEETEKTKTGCFACFAYCFSKLAKRLKCC